jgi:hypothetical protein
MTDAERTMREEQWMLTQEFVDADYPIPPIVAAFRLIQPAQWELFLSDIDDNSALRFFNPELNDFNCASSWESLAADNGIEPYDAVWSIDPRLDGPVRDFCRELRSALKATGNYGTGGLQSFVFPDGVYPSAAAKPLLIVQHDGGALAPYFNSSYERPAEYRLVDQLLRTRNMWRECWDAGTTYIYRS